MHSLFSRARTTSQTKRKDIDFPSDEFGRTNGAYRSETLPPVPPKKDKKDKDKRRQRTTSIPKDSRPSFLRSPSPDAEPVPPLPPLQAGGFLPRYIPSAPSSAERDDPARTPYGYLSTEKDVILSLDDVQRLLTILGEEITLRCLSTPLLFSTQALKLSAPRVKNLIRAFLSTCSDPISRQAETRFREEARFAGPHEVAMTIRWGLARIVRMVNGSETHGIMDFEVYRAWRANEQGKAQPRVLLDRWLTSVLIAQRYPPDHFTAILPGIPPPARPIFTSIFTLLSRLTAYSTKSGLTPPTLAGYFGPLIFGLVPAATSSFSSTLTSFYRAAHATEHLLLSHIRWEDDSQRRKTPGTGGLPSRLKDWIRGYPKMLPSDLDRVRRGAKTARVASVRRNVRLYSPDLVQSAASWAGEGDMSGRAEWLRVVPKGSGLTARYTDTYRKRLDIPAPTLTSESKKTQSTDGHQSWLSSETSLTSIVGATAAEEEKAKYSSLTDMKWGEFMATGFGDGETEGKRLEFDLNEGARQSRLEKRATMTWSDFSAAGFMRDEAPLSETLQFAAPLSTTIQTWPTASEDLHRKLKKQQKVLPTFGWETTPVAGQEWVVEEAFLDCWADLIWSSGWSEREERTHRDSNWALVDYKALPPTGPLLSLSTSSDPRTSNQWFVFEEFVPREYRDQLTNPKKKRNALGFTIKPKQWKPATTLNGKPYQSGMVPSSPGLRESSNTRDSDFDAMLSSRGVTRKISVGTQEEGSIESGTGILITAPLYTTGSSEVTPTTPTPKRPTASPRFGGTATRSGGGLSARFKLGSTSKRGMVGSEYDSSLEFETRTASETSDGGSPDQSHPPVRSFGLPSPGRNHSRRQSKDDAWVDILVADQGRRMRDQDASFRNGAGPTAFPTVVHGSTSTLRRGRANSDPDMPRGSVYGDNEADFTVTSAPVPVSPPSRFRFVEDEEEMEITRVDSPDPAGGSQAAYTRDSEISYSQDTYGRDSQGPYGRDSRDSGHLREPTSSEPVPPGRPSYESAEDYEPDSDFEPTSDGGHTQEMTSASRRLGDDTAGSIAFSDLSIDDPTTSSLGQPVSSRLGGNTGGGVRSLVQMYAERDKEALAAPKPSRLPVRVGSNIKSDELGESLPAPPIPPALEPGRASPSRYVHGAPLQNVEEEPDE
ncbi:hypothetical protein RHS04_09376 [Rhizoctonia solani]|uniref:Meiotically up-regulated protein Msb1/Mug8 domain-containing protein n=1 Tax=Rhizoctonia solani TaxID=456999 RepID=A0A8H7H167_9AGAM|nr:hypothetical protein RHS04_09376 [Rhizoctonia solani]